MDSLKNIYKINILTDENTGKNMKLCIQLIYNIFQIINQKN